MGKGQLLMTHHSVFVFGEFNLKVQRVEFVFAPEERDVYSPMLSLLSRAPEERNVLVGSPARQMFRS